MSNLFDQDDGVFLVLINDEGQYSLWPESIDIPAGWTATGPRGSREVCSAWVDETWTDMRPRSLVRQMEADA